MNNPKYPPSPAGDPNTKRLDIKEGMREVSSNYSAIVLVVIVGYNMGNAEAYDIMFNAFLEPFGITSVIYIKFILYIYTYIYIYICPPSCNYIFRKRPCTWG